MHTVRPATQALERKQRPLAVVTKDDDIKKTPYRATEREKDYRECYRHRLETQAVFLVLRRRATFDADRVRARTVYIVFQYLVVGVFELGA